jgi:hypothetical protein
MSGIEGHNGYYLRKSGERVSELLSRQFIVPTLPSAPTSTTLRWRDGEYDVDFRVGEMCRVRQGGEWVFYRLDDTSNGVAVWSNANASELPDMTDYYTKQEVDSRLEDKADVDDLGDYYTKRQVDDLISDIEAPGGGGGVVYITQEEYDALKETDSIVERKIYFVTINDEPSALYIGKILIAQREEGQKGFTYNFPIIF